MYKALFTLGIIVGFAGIIGLSTGIYFVTNWQRIAHSGNLSQQAGLFSINSLVIGIIIAGLIVSSLGAGLSAWAYGKRNDQQPGNK